MRPAGRRRTFALALLLSLSLGIGLGLGGGRADDSDDSSFYVRFSGSSQIADAIDYALNGAHKSVRVMAYSFTDGQIADALIRAKARGCDVRVMIDAHRARESRSVVPMLMEAGVTVLTDGGHPIFHHKVICIDERRTFCGSYNYTMQSRRNAEASLDIVDRHTASVFLGEWDRHAAHADELGRP